MVWKLLKGRTILPLLAALVALIVAAPSWAQTTGQLRVTVIDEDGFEIPGVKLELSGDVLIGGTQVRQTDGFGQFLFVELPPGIYELILTKDEFAAVTMKNIRINLQRTTVMPITMQSDEVTEVVVEAKQVAVDVESTSRSQVLTREFLEKIPAGRNYQTAITFAAGVQDNGSGNPNIGGGQFNENTYLLDGVNITDPVTGTFSLNFNFDAIQQIEVLLGGYMPEYGVSSGGIVNLVTRSGTNNLEYETSFFYTNGNLRTRLDERITADGFVLAPTGFDQTFELFQANALISGPVIRDKAWFIISYSHERSLIAAAAVPQRRDYDAHYMLARLTVQPSTEHRLSMSLQTDPTNIANQIQGTPFIEAEAQQQQTQGGYVLGASWQWFLSPEINLDTVGSIQKSFIENYAVPCTHDSSRDWHQCEPGEQEGNFDFETPGRQGSFGGAFSSVNATSYDFDDRLRYTISTKLNLLSVNDPFGGTHDFKFGAEAIQLVWDRVVGANGNRFYVDANFVPFDPTSLTNFYWQEWSAPVDFRITSSQYNVFVQDSWKPVSNLTINFGSRFDTFAIRNDLGEPVLSAGLLGPRLFGSWDPFKDQRTKIATGFGRFNDTGRLGVADYTSASGFGNKLYFGERGGPAPNFVADQDDLRVYNPRQNLNTAYENLRTPRVDEIILLIEREIVEDVALSSRMSGKFFRFMFEQDDTNLIWDSDGSTIIGARRGDPANFYGRLRTPALAQRDVFQWDLGVRKLYSRRWQADITYTYINAVGSSQGTLSGAFLIDPRTRWNYGNLNLANRHTVIATGFWDLPTDPWTQTLSFAFRYQSGLPLERLFFSELGAGNFGLRIRPRGTYLQFNPQWFLSVGFRQSFDVRKGRINVSLQALNLTNNRAPWFPSQGALSQQNRLLTVFRQDPLRLQAGIEYEF